MTSAILLGFFRLFRFELPFAAGVPAAANKESAAGVLGLAGAVVSL